MCNHCGGQKWKSGTPGVESVLTNSNNPSRFSVSTPANSGRLDCRSRTVEDGRGRRLKVLVSLDKSPTSRVSLRRIRDFFSVLLFSQKLASPSIEPTSAWTRTSPDPTDSFFFKQVTIILERRQEGSSIMGNLGFFSPPAKMHSCSAPITTN